MNDFLRNLAVTIETGSGAGQVDITTISEADLLQNGLNLAYFIAGIIAVIVIIVAGLNYTTSGGDSGKVAKAKNLILYSVIGLVVIIIAFALTNFIIEAF